MGFLITCFFSATCPTLEHPENGMVTQFGYSPGSIAWYQCNEDYELKSGVSSTRTCSSDGQWTGVAPVCECKYSR